MKGVPLVIIEPFSEDAFLFWLASVAGNPLAAEKPRFSLPEQAIVKDIFEGLRLKQASRAWMLLWVFGSKSSLPKEESQKALFLKLTCSRKRIVLENVGEKSKSHFIMYFQP